MYSVIVNPPKNGEPTLFNGSYLTVVSETPIHHPSGTVKKVVAIDSVNVDGSEGTGEMFVGLIFPSDPKRVSLRKVADPIEELMATIKKAN